jgi:hypothetical protein
MKMMMKAIAIVVLFLGLTGCYLMASQVKPDHEKPRSADTIASNQN